MIAPLETSYRIPPLRPVYVVAAPIAHVANTKANRPVRRGRRTSSAGSRPATPAIPRRYGATWAVRKGRLYRLPLVKVLLVTLYFPPAGGGGVQRPLKFATHLPGLGIETHVLAPDDPKWIHRDDDLPTPTLAWVHRVRFVGPRGRKPAEELHGTAGLERYQRQLELFGRRLLFPDENVSWNLTAIPAALRICRDEGIDVVITTSPPGLGALRRRRRQARRRRRAGSPTCATRSSRTRTATRSGWSCARRSRATRWSRGSIASQADAIVDRLRRDRRRDARARPERARCVTIANGSDFDDFAGLEYSGRTYEPDGPPFRITHAGSFFGKRDPKPFLTALARVDGVVARFVGDFRADRPRVGRRASPTGSS